MTVLVTGAGGFLGGHLVDLLVERGDRVRVLARPGEDVVRLDEAGVEVCRGDLRDRASLDAAVAGVDSVLNCAARTGSWGPESEFRDVNVTGLEALVRAALAAGVRRFVHVSSISVHGTDVRGWADETTPLRGGADPYSRTKVEGERLLERLIAGEDAPVTIIRPGLIYGPRDTNSFARFAGLIERGGMPVIGSGHNRLPLVFVTDVAEGIVLATEADTTIGNAYLLVNDESVTQLDYFSTIAAELDVAPPHRHIPYRMALALGAAGELVGHLARMRQPPPVTRFGLQQIGGDNRFRIDRARLDLGFSPRVGVEEGVRESIAWYRARSRGELVATHGGRAWTS